VRRVLPVLAAVPLVVVAPAVAHAGSPDGESPCQVPTIETQYDADKFMVQVSLPASGCAAREHRMFELATTVTRMDNNGSHDVSDRSTMCGPFRSAADVEGDAGQYGCDLSVAVDHPNVEAAQYDIDITYPGATGDRTMSDVVFCRSDGGTGSCEELAAPAERDTER
jgi:hypothetical protein